MSTAPGLVPKLDVSSVSSSLRFYEGVLGFVVSDPDGYLWRPFQHLGQQPVDAGPRPRMT